MIACLLAVVLAYAGRLDPSPAARLLAASSPSMGYALPGSVIAVGVLLPLAWLDRGSAALLERVLGRPVGLLLTGSAVGLVVAYVVRFLAVSLQTVDASLTRIPPQPRRRRALARRGRGRRAPARAPAADPRRAR